MDPTPVQILIFCFTSDPIENEASSADELFSNGLIRRYNSAENIMPVENSPAKKHVLLTITNRLKKQKISKEIVSDGGCEGNQLKSFWRMKRSSSLRCDSIKQKSSFWSSLPLLSRSSSTGSVMKDCQKTQKPLQKQSNKNSSMAVASNNNGYSSMKPPLKRNYGRGYDSGIRVSPVLNTSPPFISKGVADLLGLGSFFCHGSDQKTRK